MLETYNIDDVFTEELVEQLKGRPFGLGSRARDLDGFEIYEDPLRHWTILTSEEAARWVEVQIERRVEEHFEHLQDDPFTREREGVEVEL